MPFNKEELAKQAAAWKAEESKANNERREKFFSEAKLEDVADSTIIRAGWKENFGKTYSKLIQDVIDKNQSMQRLIATLRMDINEKRKGGYETMYCEFILKKVLELA